MSRKPLALAARAFCHRPALLSRSKRAAVSTRKPSQKMMRVLESVVTDSGLASTPPSYRCKDRPLAFSCTSTSKTHIIALQERWIHLRLKRNSFHTAFQALQDQSIWPNLVDLSKNWRGMHDDKNQEILHRTLETLLALSGPITSSR